MGSSKGLAVLLLDPAAHSGWHSADEQAAAGRQRASSSSLEGPVALVAPATRVCFKCRYLQQAAAVVSVHNREPAC